MIGHVFETLGVKRVTAYAAVDNTASRHVAEAVGFRQYGVERYGAQVRDDWVDMALYDVTASEWAAGAVQRERDREHGEPGQRQPAPITSGDR